MKSGSKKKVAKAKKPVATSSRKGAAKKQAVQKPAAQKTAKKGAAGVSASKPPEKKTAPASASKTRTSGQTAASMQLSRASKSRLSEHSPAATLKPLTMPATAPVKPKLSTPVASARVDLPPETGYSVVVDGHFKGHHEAQSAALADAKALKVRYPFLRIEIFDAAKKTRSSVG